MSEMNFNEWYEPITADWSIQRMKNIMSPREERSTDGEEELLSVTINEGVIKRSEYLNEDEGTSRADSLIGYKVVSPTNLVNNIMKMSFRCLGVSSHKGIVSPAYSVFELKHSKVDPSYLNFLLRIDRYIAEYRKLSKGIQESRMRLYDDFFLAMKVIVPPLKEQKLISRYLDKKTSQIDLLINKVEKKIELLKEQRISSINQYVTKGLDLNVEKKDSGIEWIGEIPRHWVITKLKYVSEITLGKMLTPEDKGGMTLQRYLRSVNVQEDRLELDDVNEMWFSTHEIQKLSILAGDIFVNEGGQVGRPCFIQSNLDGVGFQNSLNRVRSTKLDSYYLYALILSGFKYGYYDSIVDRVSIPHLTKDKLENTYALIPPIDEQREISKKVLIAIQGFNSMIQKELQRCRLLLEYRQSLISSVVTGKVRVTEDMV